MAAVDGPPKTPLELAIAERNAVALGVPIADLMEEAGRVVAEEVAARVPDRTARIVVLAGAGNNGGDGLSAVHHLLAAGRHPELWMVAGIAATRSIAARRFYDSVVGATVARDGPPKAADLAGAALVIDAMLGTGQTGSLRGPYRDAVEAIRSSVAPVLSVDVPTGMGGPEGVRPTWTVTLSAPKVGLDSTTGGTVLVRSVGIPEDAFARAGPGEYLAYPPPSARGRSGRIAVVGGGPYSGAPALAALAALRAGAERATVFAPSPAVEAIRALSPDLVAVQCGSDRFGPSDVDHLLADLRATRLGAVVLGMGLGRAPDTVGAVGTVLEALAGSIPLVVDADALDALPPRRRDANGPPVVATPNEGEFARIFGRPPAPEMAERKEQVLSAAAERGVVLVLKGREDVIAGGGDVVVAGPHVPSMNVGGSGDVLAGVIGRLLAAGLPGVAAARLAAQWLDDAGRLSAARAGDGLLATDLIAELPVALVDGLRTARLG